MQQQMPEEEKMKKCNYIIHNDNVTALIPQVLQIHEKLLNIKYV